MDNKQSLSDEQHLIQLLQTGDEDAFRAVYDYYWPIMYSHALRMLQGEQDAEDLVQELFISFYQQIPSLKGESSIGGYLFVTLRHKVINQVRNLRVRKHLLASWTDWMAQAGNIGESPLAHIQLKELEEWIADEIARMPKKMKQIFELSRQQYLSHKEIAAQLKLSDKTVKTQVNNALKILRSKLRVLVWQLL